MTTAPITQAKELLRLWNLVGSDRDYPFYTDYSYTHAPAIAEALIAAEESYGEVIASWQYIANEAREENARLRKALEEIAVGAEKHHQMHHAGDEAEKAAAERDQATMARLRKALEHIAKHDDGTWPLEPIGKCDLGDSPGDIARQALSQEEGE